MQHCSVRGCIRPPSAGLSGMYSIFKITRMDSVIPKEIEYNHNYEAQFVRGIERRYEGQNTLTQPKACFIAKATRCINILSKRLTYLCNYFSIFENDAVKHCNDVSERSGITKHPWSIKYSGVFMD